MPQPVRFTRKTHAKRDFFLIQWICVKDHHAKPAMMSNLLSQPPVWDHGGCSSQLTRFMGPSADGDQNLERFHLCIDFCQESAAGLGRGNVHQIMSNENRLAAAREQGPHAPRERAYPWVPNKTAPPARRATGRNDTKLCHMGHQGANDTTIHIDVKGDRRRPNAVQPTFEHGRQPVPPSGINKDNALRPGQKRRLIGQWVLVFCKIIVNPSFLTTHDRVKAHCIKVQQPNFMAAMFQTIDHRVTDGGTKAFWHWMRVNDENTHVCSFKMHP